MKQCVIPGCGGRFVARGYCRSHYARWQRCGDPLKADTRSNTEEDFWSKVSIGGDDECWLWQKGKDEDGYGAFWWHNRQVKAHRFSWELFSGAVPDGLQVLHGCDTPSCVNPSHLFLGTTQDNTADRNNKGRQIKGESCHSAILSEQQVIEIRKLSSQNVSGRKLARMFGVHYSAIYKLLKGRSWKHVSA